MVAPEIGTRLPAAYWRLWWASAVDNVGDGAFAVAVPLLALSITRDPRLISVVSAATYLPWLLLSLIVGAVVDRREKITLMWSSQAIQAILVLVLAAMVWLHSIDIWGLAGLAFALGSCEVVFGNAATAVLPDLVAKPLLHQANGNQYAVSTVGQMFLGPPLGSALFSLARGLPFVVDAGSFAASAALVTRLPHTRGRSQPVGSPLRSSIAEGARWLRRHRLLRTLALLLGANNFCNQLGNVTLVLLATETLHLNPSGYGLLLAGAAIGSVLGGIVNSRVVAFTGPVLALLIALTANAVVFVAIGFSPDAVVLGVLLALNGFITTLWNIVTVSLRQQVVPADLLGRVNSIYKMIGWGLIPLGALAGGLLAHTFGLRAGYPIAGGLRFAALLTALPVLLAVLRLPLNHDGVSPVESPQPD